MYGITSSPYRGVSYSTGPATGDPELYHFMPRHFIRAEDAWSRFMRIQQFNGSEGVVRTWAQVDAEREESIRSIRRVIARAQAHRRSARRADGFMRFQDGTTLDAIDREDPFFQYFDTHIGQPLRDFELQAFDGNPWHACDILGYGARQTGRLIWTLRRPAIDLAMLYSTALHLPTLGRAATYLSRGNLIHELYSHSNGDVLNDMMTFRTHLTSEQGLASIYQFAGANHAEAELLAYWTMCTYETFDPRLNTLRNPAVQTMVHLPYIASTPANIRNIGFVAPAMAALPGRILDVRSTAFSVNYYGLDRFDHLPTFQPVYITSQAHLQFINPRSLFGSQFQGVPDGAWHQFCQNIRPTSFKHHFQRQMTGFPVMQKRHAYRSRYIGELPQPRFSYPPRRSTFESIVSELESRGFSFHLKAEQPKPRISSPFEKYLYVHQKITGLAEQIAFHTCIAQDHEAMDETIIAEEYWKEAVSYKAERDAYMRFYYEKAVKNRNPYASFFQDYTFEGFANLSQSNIDLEGLYQSAQKGRTPDGWARLASHEVKEASALRERHFFRIPLFFGANLPVPPFKQARKIEQMLERYKKAIDLMELSLRLSKEQFSPEQTATLDTIRKSAEEINTVFSKLDRNEPAIIKRNQRLLRKIEDLSTAISALQSAKANIASGSLDLADLNLEALTEEQKSILGTEAFELSKSLKDVIHTRKALKEAENSIKHGTLQNAIDHLNSIPSYMEIPELPEKIQTLRDMQHNRQFFQATDFSMRAMMSGKFEHACIGFKYLQQQSHKHPEMKTFIDFNMAFLNAQAEREQNPIYGQFDPEQRQCARKLHYMRAREPRKYAQAYGNRSPESQTILWTIVGAVAKGAHKLYLWAKPFLQEAWFQISTASYVALPSLVVGVSLLNLTDSVIADIQLETRRYLRDVALFSKLNDMRDEIVEQALVKLHKLTPAALFIHIMMHFQLVTGGDPFLRQCLAEALLEEVKNTDDENHRQSARLALMIAQNYGPAIQAFLTLYQITFNQVFSQFQRLTGSPQKRYLARTARKLFGMSEWTFARKFRRGTFASRDFLGSSVTKTDRREMASRLLKSPAPDSAKRKFSQLAYLLAPDYDRTRHTMQAYYESHSPSQSALVFHQPQVEVLSGFRHILVPGDDHCFYHAVALYVGQPHTELRDLVAARVSSDPERYRPFIEHHAGRSLEMYLENTQSGGHQWADEIEIFALSNALNRPIVVIDPSGQIRNPDILDAVTGDPIFVYYNGVNHFDGLRLEGSRSASELLDSLPRATRNTTQQTPTESGWSCSIM